MLLLAQPATVANQPPFTDANWVSLGGFAGLNGQVNAIVVARNGDVYVGGSFTIAGTVFAANIAKWNGSTWSPLGAGIGDVNASVSALTFDSNGNLYAAGSFDTAGGISATNISKWDGSTWSALGPGIGGDAYGGYVEALAFDSNGNLYAGGYFDAAGGVSATNIAKWDGSTWSALGPGIGGDGYGANGGQVYALAWDNNGNLYSGGEFDIAGGVAATNIAKWDGTIWSALGSGVSLGDLGSPLEFEYVSALTFDANGHMYAALDGEYGNIDGQHLVSGAFTWNGSNWSNVVTVIGGSVFALGFDSSANLYLGGSFDSVNSISATNIAKWDGTAWSALVSGVGGGAYGGQVSALAFDNSGNLYAGGSFYIAGGVGADSIAEWDRTSWSPLGSGIIGPFNEGAWTAINALAFDRAGNLYVSVELTFPPPSNYGGGEAAGYISRWDGSAWTTLWSGMGNDTFINALAFDTNGNLYAGGCFKNAGDVSANNIAKWDGSTWSALGSGIGGGVAALAFDGNGNLYAGGEFITAGGAFATNIAKWDGSAWSALGAGAGTDGDEVNALVCDASGNLYAGGFFGYGSDVLKWDGSGWSGLGGVGEWATTLALDANQNLYAGGMEGSFVGQWSGSAWSDLGSAVIRGDSVYALAIAPSGDLYAGGDFSGMGGMSATNIAKWDGNAWSPLGSGVDRYVDALAFDKFGNLYVGGWFTTAGTNVSASLAKAILTGPTPNHLVLANAGGGTNVITYLGTPGANYALDLATSLAAPVRWIPQTTNTASTANAATAGYLTFTNSNRLPQAYYRTRQVP